MTIAIARHAAMAEDMTTGTMNMNRATMAVPAAVAANIETTIGPTGAPRATAAASCHNNTACRTSSTLMLWPKPR